MSRKAAAATLVLTLLLSITVLSLVTNGAFAQMGPIMNPGPDFTPISISVSSPLNNRLYSQDFELSFTLTKPSSWFTSGAILYNYDCQGKVNSVQYSIDGLPSVKIPANDTYFGRKLCN
jgi:hypothetical protein